MSKDKKRREGMPSPGLSALSLLLIAALWIVFVGGTRRDEVIAGAGVFLLSGAFLYQVWRTETLRLEVRWEDVVQGWRIPWYVVSGVFLMAAV